MLSISSDNGIRSGDEISDNVFDDSDEFDLYLEDKHTIILDPPNLVLGDRYPPKMSP
jgi:hypothetical protein